MNVSTDATEMKTYKARCHCNATIFTVTIPPLETGATKVNQCNCSICTKSGYNLVYPLREDVKFLKGEAELKEYLFGTKSRPHRFCGVCGTSILIDFGNLESPNYNTRLAVSIRTFDNIEELITQGKITWRQSDGKGLMKPAYAPLAEEEQAE